MILIKLSKAGLIHPPRWLEANTVYLTIMGSAAYGVSEDTSDVDLYGFCIPPKDIVFPHLAGVIPGFGNQGERFDQWQEHHIPNPDGADRTYDMTVFSVLKYFQLCMDNNPNVIDSLFTPRVCVLHTTAAGEHMREARRTFLHKGAWHKFKGYAYSQMGKIRAKTNALNEKRAAPIATHGYDLKFAYHTVRLLNEVEQIMVEGDLDLQRNREQLKAIRRGEWTLEHLEGYFTNKEKVLELQYAKSALPNGPDEAAVKKVLLECLETHYGSLDNAFLVIPDTDRFIRDLEAVISKYR